MKRICSIAMAGIIVGLFAVNSMALDMSAGVKGGLAMASMTGADAAPPAGAEKSMLLGANVGGIFNVNFSPIFGLELDLMYSMKGMTWKATSGDAKINFKGAYLDIPLLAKFIVPMEGAIKPVVYAGPSFGILLSSKMNSTGGGQDTTMDTKDHTKSLDFGLAAGVGAEIGAGPGNLLVDVRYTMGFSTTAKLTQAEIDAGDPVPELKTSVLSFMAGYAFKF